jgi:hypothetical protein
MIQTISCDFHMLARNSSLYFLPLDGLDGGESKWGAGELLITHGTPEKLS